MKIFNNRIGQVIFFALLFLFSCNTHEQKNDLPVIDRSTVISELTGIYIGVFPCSDCQGALTTIELNKDFSYKTHMVYLEQDYKSTESSGVFSLNNDSTKITLIPSENGFPETFQVELNMLILLDQNGKQIPTNFGDLTILRKDKHEITGTIWKLIEYNENAVQFYDKMINDFFMLLDPANQLVLGKFGCNSFGGSYQFNNRKGIDLKLDHKLKSCDDLSYERRLFLSKFQFVDNYVMESDTLVLNMGETPLVRLIAVKKY